MKTSIKILALTFMPACGATVWQAADNGLASASWDSFTFSSGTAGDSGSQGTAQATTGSLITSSGLTTEILQGYNSPPGGFNGNPDTYYFHNGAAQWTGNVVLTSGATHVRVSYALLGFGGGAPEAYGQAPEITGATVINSGAYNTASSTVFFTDLELAASSTTVEVTFGDALFPMFPGSFRSLDAAQIEVFGAAPVPEPSSALLGGLAALICLRRKRS
ncbi:MAG: hypothetical protein ACJAQT_001523 [Akkermansiaceae bacterium]|jgi:hypothetical protein